MTADLPSLTLVRRIKAPPSKVYAACTRPEQIARWWGPDAGPVLIAETDVRPGGRFRVLFQTLDGSQHDCGGVYRVVEPDRRLEFTWVWVGQTDPDTLVTIELRPVTEGTELTFTHAQFANEPERDGHRRGWTGSLDKLERLFAEP